VSLESPIAKSVIHRVFFGHCRTAAVDPPPLLAARCGCRTRGHLRPMAGERIDTVKADLAALTKDRTVQRSTRWSSSVPQRASVRCGLHRPRARSSKYVKSKARVVRARVPAPGGRIKESTCTRLPSPLPHANFFFFFYRRAKMPMPPLRTRRVSIRSLPSAASRGSDRRRLSPSGGGSEQAVKGRHRDAQRPRHRRGASVN